MMYLTTPSVAQIIQCSAKY